MENREKNIEQTLIIAYLNGDQLEDTQKKDIENWLQDDLNQQEARRIYQAWELSSLTSNKFVDSNDGLLRLRKRLASSNEKRAKVKYVNWQVIGIAALLVIGIASAFWFAESKESPSDIEISSLNSKENFTLPDSSLISLNSNSSLKYADAVFQKDSELRMVHLVGEAYFEVKHDQFKPFSILTKDAEIVVVGTKFFVKSLPNEPTTVMVTEGKVEVTSLITKEKYVLEAKREVTLDTVAKTGLTELNENKLFWQTEILRFDNDSLSTVFNILSKEFSVSIQTQNKNILNCKLTATFRKQSLKDIIRVIEATHELTSKDENDTIEISGNGCK